MPRTLIRSSKEISWANTSKSTQAKNTCERNFSPFYRSPRPGSCKNTGEKNFDFSFGTAVKKSTYNFIFFYRQIVGEGKVGLEPQTWGATKDSVTTRLSLEPSCTLNYIVPLSTLLNINLFDKINRSSYSSHLDQTVQVFN